MLDDLSPLAYFRTELRVLLTYLRLLVVPWPQALEYEFATVESWFDPGAVLGLAAAAGLLAIAVSVTRRPRWYWSGMGLAAFLVLLAPTSTIIPSRDFAFEHRLYLPLVGAALAAGHMFSFARRRNLVVTVVVVVFALLSVNRLRAWSDNVTLWEDTVRRAPGKARAWFNLGGAYLAAGDPRAGETFLRVLELDPESIEARYNLGILAQAERRPFEALGWYAEVTALDPTYWPAVNNGGNVYFSLMEYSRAIAAFGRVLELNPDHWPAQYNLALSYNALDRPDLAEPRLRTVLDWRPEFAEARYLLGLSLQRLGRVDEARQEFEAVFEATFQAMDGGNSVGGPADLNEADLIELDALEPLQ
jgi:tetratricopeptide (TPR) repeat protein